MLFKVPAKKKAGFELILRDMKVENRNLKVLLEGTETGPDVPAKTEADP